MLERNNMDESLLVIGLGNPGREYRDTRHNIGFKVLDQLAVKLDIRFSRLQSKALVASAIHHERRIILAKPQTYMNFSGRAVRGLIGFYKLSFTNILIVNDDLDLPVGTIRIKPDGGSAGHKGVISIIQHLGTDEFPRLRLGIGHPPGQMQSQDYVLQGFSETEFAIVSETISRAADAILVWVLEGLDAAMNHFNGMVQDSN
jgi:PTH1 family peptidyl-tRNA hydrolase